MNLFKELVKVWARERTEISAVPTLTTAGMLKTTFALPLLPARESRCEIYATKYIMRSWTNSKITAIDETTRPDDMMLEGQVQGMKILPRGMELSESESVEHERKRRRIRRETRDVQVLSGCTPKWGLVAWTLKSSIAYRVNIVRYINAGFCKQAPLFCQFLFHVKASSYKAFHLFFLYYIIPLLYR